MVKSSEDKVVTISRATGTLTFAANFMLVAAPPKHGVLPQLGRAARGDDPAGQERPSLPDQPELGYWNEEVIPPLVADIDAFGLPTLYLEGL